MEEHPIIPQRLAPGIPMKEWMAFCSLVEFFFDLLDGLHFFFRSE